MTFSVVEEEVKAEFAKAADHFKQAYIEFWKTELTEHKLNEKLLAATIISALVHNAAVIAVDVGMTPEILMKVCAEQYKAAYEKAPKWG